MKNTICQIKDEVLALNQKYIDESDDYYDFWEQHIKYVVNNALDLDILAHTQSWKTEENIKILAKSDKKLMRTDHPECQVGGDSWVGYVLGTVGCLKEGYTLGYDKDGIHYTYLDRVEWLCRCGLAPYITELQDEVELLANAIDENGICRASVDENQLRGISTYGGQQLEVDWKTETKKLCDITFRASLIIHYAGIEK